MTTSSKVVIGIIVAIALIGGGILAGTQVAQAQTADAPYACCGGYGYMMQGAGPGTMMRGGPGRGAGPWGGWMYEYHDEMQAAIAKVLGISVDELNEALQAGKSPWQIAQEKGISAEDFQKAMLDAHKEILAQAVKDGKITQEQADEMLEHMEEYPGMMGWGYGYGPMGPGMMRGGRGGRWQNNNPYWNNNQSQ